MAVRPDPPASEPRRNAESTLQEQIPKVHDQGCADAHGDRAKDGACFKIHDLPRCGYLQPYAAQPGPTLLQVVPDGIDGAP